MKDHLKESARPEFSPLREDAADEAAPPARHDVAAPEPLPEKNTAADTPSERRLSDIFRARTDLLDRMGKTLARLERDRAMQEELQKSREAAILFLISNIDELEAISDPAEVGDIRQYVRELEKLRIDFFRYEAQTAHFQFGAAESGGSSIRDMGDLKTAEILRYAFLWSLPFLLVLLIAAAMIGGAILLSIGV